MIYVMYRLKYDTTPAIFTYEKAKNLPDYVEPYFIKQEAVQQCLYFLKSFYDYDYDEVDICTVWEEEK